MTSSSPTQFLKDPAQQSNSQVIIPLNNILRHLALDPGHGQTLLPSTWTLLRLSKSIEAELQELPSANANYHLQHKAHAVYDNATMKWKIQGDNHSSALRILGIVVSKQHGARAIQLPNHTHKIVSGIINAEKLVNLFEAPKLTSNNKKVTLTPIGDATVLFVAIVPHQAKLRSSSGADKTKIHSDSKYQHLQYILHSNRQSNTQHLHEVHHSHLNWSKQDKIELQNGSDITDLAKYKNILAMLRAGLLEDDTIKITGSKREVLEKRLILLEHQIDGLLKRKIVFTSKDQKGTRFLDYTTILNDKENQIISLHKKIDNLTVRLQNQHKKEQDFHKQIDRLSHALQALNNPNVTKQQIKDILLLQFEAKIQHAQAIKLKGHLETSHKLMQNHFEDLKLKGVKIENQKELKGILTDPNFETKIKDGIVHLVQTRDKIIEVPIQDAKNGELIKQMGAELLRIYQRYPKVKGQADPNFIHILNSQILHIVDKDGLGKITQIIKYIPSVVKVQNVYNYNTDKQRKLEFHLKILLKSLLLQFEKLKVRSGVVPEIDESVILMIQKQIGDVEIDDILKVFQVNHKIVQVPKIVEKIVERVVEVPTVLPVQKIVEKIVEVIKIQEVQKIIHFPIQIIKYVDRIVEKIVQVQKIKQKVVEVPRIIEKIVEKRVEVPKIIEVEVIKQKIVEVEKPVIVQKIVNQVVPEIREVFLNKQETVVVKQVVQKIKQVEVIVQKIVQRIIEKPVIVEVEKIVEKLVNTIQYKPARQVVNHIEQVPQIVQRIVQKVIPIIQTVERIKEVTKIVEKIVEVRVQVPTVKEIKVIQEKIVYVDRIKQVEKIVQKVVPLIHQQIKQVQKRVEVPIIQEKIVKVPEIMEKVIPEKIETVKIVEVEKIVQKLVEVPKIMEVIKTVVKYITIEKPVKVIVEVIVEVPKIIERIKEVRVPIDKIIQKLVEVPKVVEIEKIVERIVIVPRIIEKIVQVPRIVQKIVDRIIQIEKIKEVIREVRIPIIQEKVVEIEIIKYIQVPIYKTIQIIRQKVVPAISTKEVIKEVNVVKEKIVENRVEIPKDIFIDKLVSQTVELEKIVEVEKALVIPFEVPVQCDKVIEKLIIIEKQVEKPIQVQVKVEKIVQVIKEVATVKELTRVEEKIVISERIREVEKIVPYITEKVTAVETIRQKPVLTTQIQERIKLVSAIQQKIVQIVHEVPKIYEVQKVIEKFIQVPKYIEITSKEPIFITSHKIVDRFIDKIVQVHTVEQQIVAVPTIQQKIVTIEKLVQQIKEISVNKDRIIEKDKLILKTDVNNQVQTKYSTVDRIEEKLVPINSSYEKIVGVPHIIEKIVERIVLMPQVHQVTQHIYDIQEQANPGVAIDVNFEQHKAKYMSLYLSLKKDTDGLVQQLKLMQKQHPELKQKLNSIIIYINSLDEVIAFPKIVQVTKDKIVNKEVAVPIFHSRKDPQSIKSEAYYLIVIQKLVDQLKTAKSKSAYHIHNEELNFLFLNDANKEDDKQIRDKIYHYGQSENGKKGSDNALLNGALYDKYHLSGKLQNSKLQNERQRKISQERLSLLHQFKQTNDQLHLKIQSLQQRLRVLSKQSLSKQCGEELKRILTEIQLLDELLYNDIKKIKINQPLQNTTRIHGTDVIYKLQQTKIRELEAEIQLLKTEFIKKEGSRINQNALADKERVINSLTKTITHLMDKGTKSTLHDREDENITSIDALSQKKHRYSKTHLSGETSILNRGKSPMKSGEKGLAQYSIVYQSRSQGKVNLDQLGYIVLPENARERSAGYKLIENKDSHSYTLIPIGSDERGNNSINQGIVNADWKQNIQPIVTPSVNLNQLNQTPTKPIATQNIGLIQSLNETKTQPIPIVAMPSFPSNQSIDKGVSIQQISTQNIRGDQRILPIIPSQSNQYAQNNSNNPKVINETISKPSLPQSFANLQNQQIISGLPINDSFYQPTVPNPISKNVQTIDSRTVVNQPHSTSFYQAIIPNATTHIQTENHIQGTSIPQTVVPNQQIGSYYQAIVPNQTSVDLKKTPIGQPDISHGVWTPVLPQGDSDKKIVIVDQRNIHTGPFDSNHHQIDSRYNKSYIHPSQNYIIQEEHVTSYPFGQNWLPYPPNFIVPTSNIQSSNRHIISQPNSTNLDPSLSKQRLHFTYQQPGVITPIQGNMFVDPSKLFIGQPSSHVSFIDSQTGAKVEGYNQAGLLGSRPEDGATFTTNYLYRSQVKQTGEGQNKIQTKTTEIRANQTVNWISRSRVIETQIQQRKKQNSPIKDIESDRR